MHHQHRHRHALQILSEIGLRERHDAVVMRLRAANHALAPPVGDNTFLRLGTRSVIAVERTARHISIELRTIGRKLRLQVIEHRFRQTTRVAFGLDHQRWYRADDRGFEDFVLAMAGDVVDDFTAAGGVADVHGFFHAQMVDHRQDIIGVVIHVVTVPDLARTSMTTAIMGNHPKALPQKEQHLCIPVVGAERPAMVKVDDRGVLRSPVLVENFDAILGGDKSHVRYS